MPYADPEKQKQYQREWCAKRRAKFFADKQCVRCGSTDQLELDHLDPTRKATHKIWSWSRARRESELAKCQVLCHACHKEKTLEQYELTSGLKRLQHGQYGMYSKWGCRCALCMEAMRRYWRSYRSRTRTRT